LPRRSALYWHPCNLTQVQGQFAYHEIVPTLLGKHRLVVPTLMLNGTKDFALASAELGGYEPFADDLVARFAAEFGVSRPTIYRHLTKTADPAQAGSLAFRGSPRAEPRRSFRGIPDRPDVNVNREAGPGVVSGQNGGGQPVREREACALCE
jgi:hypothetical protein